MKILRMVAVFLIGVLLIGGFAHAANAFVVKPIRLHFALASGCKILKSAGQLDANSSVMLRNKVSSAFVSAAQIDYSYLSLSQAVVFLGVAEGKTNLSDAWTNKLLDSEVTALAYCGGNAT